MAHERNMPTYTLQERFAWELSKAKWVAAEIINRMAETSHPDTARLSGSLHVGSIPREEDLGTFCELLDFALTVHHGEELTETTFPSGKKHVHAYIQEKMDGSMDFKGHWDFVRVPSSCSDEPQLAKCDACGRTYTIKEDHDMETVCKECNHMISPPDSDAHFCPPPMPPPPMPPPPIPTHDTTEASQGPSIKAEIPAEIKWHGGWHAYVVKFVDFETESKLVFRKSNFPSAEATLQTALEYYKTVDDIRAETYGWSKQDLLLQCKKNGLAATGNKDSVFDRFMRNRAAAIYKQFPERKMDSAPDAAPCGHGSGDGGGQTAQQRDALADAAVPVQELT